MTARLPTVLLCAAFTLTAVAVTPNTADARGSRKLKKLAMKRFHVDSGEVSIVRKAPAKGMGSAAIARVERSEAPTCYLMVLDSSASKVKTTVRLPVCPAYGKHSRSAKLKAVPLTSHKQAWRVYLASKRVDMPARGGETRRLWGLYADMGTGTKKVFARTSTSFTSKVNKAVNQTEVCEAPQFPVGDEPTTLRLSCKTSAMLGITMDTRRTTLNYKWADGAFRRR